MDSNLSPTVSKARFKRVVSVIMLSLAVIAGAYLHDLEAAKNTEGSPQSSGPTINEPNVTASQKYPTAIAGLEALSVKGRAAKTGYSRSQFGDGWQKDGSCDTRNRILARDLSNISFVINSCLVESGVLNDPYTGKVIEFRRGSQSSSLVQIDHVVALSDAWQKGAQQLSPDLRTTFANDGLNLLAVDGAANQNKGDGDAATWLPSNKQFRCAYVARQTSIKLKYSLWVTAAEKNAMLSILKKCPSQLLIS